MATNVNALSGVENIESVNVDVQTKNVTLESSEEINLDLVKSLLDEQGYTVVS